MDIDFVIKIVIIGVIVAIMYAALSKSGREEQALLTTFAGLVVVFFMVIQQLSKFFETVKSLFRL